LGFGVWVLGLGFWVLGGGNQLDEHEEGPGTDEAATEYEAQQGGEARGMASALGPAGWCEAPESRSESAAKRRRGESAVADLGGVRAFSSQRGTPLQAGVDSPTSLVPSARVEAATFESRPPLLSEKASVLSLLQGYRDHTKAPPPRMLRRVVLRSPW